MSNSNAIAQFLIAVLDMNAAQATVISLMCNYREQGGIADLKTAKRLIDYILEVDFQEHTGRPLPKESHVSSAWNEWTKDIYTKMAEKLGVDLKDIDSVRFEEPKTDWVDPVISEPIDKDKEKKANDMMAKAGFVSIKEAEQMPPGEFQELTTEYSWLSPESPEVMIVANALGIPHKEIADALNTAADRHRNQYDR